MTNELVHHGVKGMKWGVRRDKKSVTPRKQRTIDRKVSTEIAKTRFKERHSVYKMSNEELKKKVDRINLENSYTQAAAKSLEYNRSRGAIAINKLRKSNEGKALLKMGVSSLAAKGAAATGSSTLAAVSAVTAVSKKKK